MNPSITDLMTNVGEVFTAAIGWVGTVADEIAGNNLLLLACVAVPLCGIGVGMFSRLLHNRL